MDHIYDSRFAHFHGNPCDGRMALPRFDWDAPAYPGPPDFGPGHGWGPPPPPYQHGQYRHPQPFRSGFRHQRGGFSNRGRNHMKVQRQKDSKDFDHFCDSCDRGFHTEVKYREHVESHEQCQVDGCTYVATPKLVKLHHNMQHRTGLAKKIWQLESKADIAKWIAERKKHYPTAENIARKSKDVQAKRARGELLETKSFGKMRDGNRKRQCNDRSNKFTRRSHLNESDGSNPKVARIDISEEQSNASMKKAESVGDPLAFVLRSDEDSDVEVKTVGEKSVPSTGVALSGGLGSLMSSYGDITESEEEEENKQPPGHKVLPASKPYHGAIKKMEHEHTRLQTQHLKNRRKGREGKGMRQRQNNQRQMNKRQVNNQAGSNPSLLEKLLAKDIRHERNVILQCVHYIVSRNFFKKDHQISQSPKEEKTETKKDCVQTESASAVDDEIWENVSVISEIVQDVNDKESAVSNEKENDDSNSLK